jgi:hypothetical protein
MAAQTQPPDKQSVSMRPQPDSGAGGKKNDPRRRLESLAGEQSACRSQIKLMYDSHHQQPQKHGRCDELDPYLVVREPSMHTIHGQPPSGYHASSNRTHYHETPLFRYGIYR